MILVLFDLNGTLIHRVRTDRIYIRPGLERLPKLDNVLYGIYTSMMKKNIVKLLPDLPFEVSVIYERSYNDIDYTVSAHDTIRNLNKILDSRFIIRHKINKKDILLIENEERKVRNWPENAFIIESYFKSMDPEQNDKNIDEIIKQIKLISINNI